jgi:Intracellular proteinase inhibitor
MGLLFLTAAATLPAAATYLPIQQGNEWTYRDSVTAATFKIQVGLGVMHQGNAYYRVTGYAPGPLYLRSASDGNLYFFDDENDREILLTNFEPVDRSWYDTMLGGCIQGYQPQAQTVAYDGPNRYFPAALDVRYRSYSCADNGIERELFVDNVGLVRRIVTTFAGPRTFDLVYARVGALTFRGEPDTDFRVSLDRTVIEPKGAETPGVRVTMRLSSYRGLPFPLRFSSSQRYDIQVRNASGVVVYRWSNDVAYAPVIDYQVFSGELSFEQQIPLLVRGGGPLPAGEYRIEAWLDTPNREFAGAAMVELRSGTSIQ